MISVVIPCYNAATTIAATIDSALGQETAREVIVVDDGSTDRSAGVIATFGDRIRGVTTTNNGVSAARTTGTRLARGDFIQYLDSDDLLMPGTLAARRATLERTSADVAHTDWQKFLESADGALADGELMRPDLAAIEADAEAATAVSAFWAPPAALLYRRALIERMPAWHLQLPVIQDARFLFDAAHAGARFTHVPGTGAKYRVSASSLSRNRQQFIADCALNAREIEMIWCQGGPLSELRREALASMWAHVASASLLNGLKDFDAARDGFNRYARPRPLFEIGCVLRSTLSAANTARLLHSLLHIKRSLGSFPIVANGRH